MLGESAFFWMAHWEEIAREITMVGVLPKPSE